MEADLAEWLRQVGFNVEDEAIVDDEISKRFAVLVDDQTLIEIALGEGREPFGGAIRLFQEQMTQSRQLRDAEVDGPLRLVVAGDGQQLAGCDGLLHHGEDVESQVANEHQFHLPAEYGQLVLANSAFPVRKGEIHAAVDVSCNN